MCKHIEIVVASRNAIVGLRASLRLSRLGASGEIEVARRENAYDSLLMSLEEECLSCKADKHNPKRDSDFLLFVSEYVEHFAGGKCSFCEE